MFWTVSFVCIAQMCSMPDPSYNPAFSFYATKEACEARISVADVRSGIRYSCNESDTVSFSPGMGFSAGSSIMMGPIKQP